jgi:hypothetical protein
VEKIRTAEDSPIAVPERRRRRRTSKVALGATSCALAGCGIYVWLGFLSGRTFLVVTASFLFTAGLVLAVIALTLISCRSKDLKGRAYAIAAMFVVLVHLASAGHWITCGVGARARAIGDWISLYIREEGVGFPASVRDLENKGYLRRTSTNDSTEYSIRFAVDGQKEHWQAFSYFELFKIAYGAKVEDVALIEGQLRGKRSGKEMLLIDGPYKRFLKSTYRGISLKWYRLMVKENEGLHDSRDATSRIQQSVGKSSIH